MENKLPGTHIAPVFDIFTGERLPVQRANNHNHPPNDRAFLDRIDKEIVAMDDGEYMSAFFERFDKFIGALDALAGASKINEIMRVSLRVYNESGKAAALLSAESQIRSVFHNYGADIHISEPIID